jgi:hypothetical protein
MVWDLKVRGNFRLLKCPPVVLTSLVLGGNQCPCLRELEVWARGLPGAYGSPIEVDGRPTRWYDRPSAGNMGAQRALVQVQVSGPTAVPLRTHWNTQWNAAQGGPAPDHRTTVNDNSISAQFQWRPKRRDA